MAVATTDPKLAFVDRVAAEAVQLKLSRLILIGLAAPFYALGVLIAIVRLVVVFAIGATRVGMRETQRRVASRPAATTQGFHGMVARADEDEDA